MKQKLISADEQDAIGKARKYHTWQRGQIKKIKRALNKRIRKEGKQIDKD